MTSSSTREDRREVSRVSDDFPVQLASRLPDRSAGGLLRCIHVELPVCPRVVSFAKFHEPDIHDLLRGHHRKDPRSILSDTTDFLVTC